MDLNGERDDLTDDDAMVAPRARAKAELDQIAQQTKRALQEDGIDLDLFFMIPSSGDAIITFGTSHDPDDDLWHRAGEIVASVLRDLIGLERVQRREVMCKTTADHQPLQSSDQSAGPSDRPPMTLPMVSLQEAGADSR